MSPAGRGNDGVQARNQSAGTPSSFRQDVADAATFATLEFAAALDLVAGHAAGPLGGASVRSRRPVPDAALVRHDLGLVAEALGLLRDPEGFDIVAVPDLGHALDRLRIEGSVLDGPDLVQLRLALAAARQVARELTRVAARAPSVGLLAVPVPERSIEQRLEHALDDEGGVHDHASPGLARARKAVQAAREQLIRKLESMLHTLDPQALAQGASVTVRNGRYVIPVRRDSRARPTGIVHDESGSAGTLFIEPADAIEGGNALREAIADESREVLKVLRELTDLVRPHAAEIRAAHAMCVSADDLQARARYARGVEAEIPGVTEAGSPLVIRNGRHPMLVAQEGRTVPFDLALEPGERTLLVSGPNAGGKTVLLKAVGLQAALLQAGIAPPVGSGSSFPVFTRIIADIGDHQSIAANLSTFSAHVATLRQVLDQADDSALVLLDELGSGTDPAEGAALAWATLETLHGRRTLTLATTHLGALKTLASQVPGVVNGSMEFDAASLSPTYRFQKGIPGRSYGLAIARRLGVDAGVLARAEAQVPDRERALDALLHEVERRDQALRAREAELTERLTRTERLAEDLAFRDEAALAREKELRRREKEADARARTQAREYLLDARRVVEAAVARAGEAKEARRVVEEAVARMAEEDGAREGPKSGSIAGLTPGVLVRLQTGVTGRVEERRGDGELVVRAGGVRLVVNEGVVAAVVPEAKPLRTSAAPSLRPDHEAPMEIDLRGMRVDEAETVTIAALDAAIQADHPFLRIIHGKGTGAVRARVHEVLKGDRRVRRFGLAPANQGGSGATLAEFRA